ncbi:MAG: potassium channel protein [Spirochaetes bacterium]|nr:potassium channel protein [Spirochaetota bacterium]MBU0957109.1 potassium channel protein [Spirochaetota bacterium]
MDSRKIRVALGLLSFTLLFGTIGLFLLEDLSLFDSFYMTVITISTVGFSELKPFSQAGRIVTIITICTGTATLAYTLGTVISMFVEGELSRRFGRRKVFNKIAKLKDHFIICGFGRIGSLICQELHEHGKKFVVIDSNPQLGPELEALGYLSLPADASSDDTLIQAGIKRAKGLVTCVQANADNVYIILCARELRPDLFILSRASDETSQSKLLKAGASQVLLPYQIGGKRMAQVLIRPTVVDFMDIAMMDNKLGLVMEETKIGDKSAFAGKNLVESGLRRDYGVIIVAIRKTDGSMHFNPAPSEVLQPGDTIVVLGQKADILRMNKIM